MYRVEEMYSADELQLIVNHQRNMAARARRWAGRFPGNDREWLLRRAAELEAEASRLEQRALASASAVQAREIS
jgi:hypothetical protein